MKKLSIFVFASMVATSVFAVDLNNTQWKTIDDKTGQPKAIVEFKKQANGTYNATIIKVLDPKSAHACANCSGALKGKSLQGVTIVQNLKQTVEGKYDGGTILDPRSGDNYKMKADVAADGTKVTVRGYIGISALGRNQIWYRVH